MSDLQAPCGCWIEVEMDWDYGGCCGQDYPSAAKITSTCDTHTPLDTTVE